MSSYGITEDVIYDLRRVKLHNPDRSRASWNNFTLLSAPAIAVRLKPRAPERTWFVQTVMVRIRGTSSHAGAWRGAVHPCRRRAESACLRFEGTPTGLGPRLLGDPVGRPVRGPAGRTPLFESRDAPRPRILADATAQPGAGQPDHHAHPPGPRHRGGAYAAGLPAAADCVQIALREHQRTQRRGQGLAGCG